jgi:hypothetical protein
MAEKKKIHPWRVWSPGSLKSNKEWAQRVIPTHARPIR